MIVEEHPVSLALRMYCPYLATGSTEPMTCQAGKCVAWEWTNKKKFLGFCNKAYQK